jgi:hypothetical protein
MALYEKILNAYRSFTKESPSEHNLSDLFEDRGFRSLLEVKAILVAIRLCGEPSAIIIDEPDWGLTRSAAVAFVSAIISVCHEFGVPVILISHKPWWLTLAKSVLRVRRTAKEMEEKGKYFFTIKLTEEMSDSKGITGNGENV